MATTQLKLRPDRKQLLVLFLAIIAIYIIVPQLGDFRRSIALLPHANWPDLGLAVIFTMLAYVAAAGTYCLLALTALRYSRTLLVQIAGTFVNRLLPAGIGGIGINYAYLRKSHHSGTEAASVVAANNTLGVVGHSLLLLVLISLFHHDLPGLQLWHVNNLAVISVAVLAGLIVWLVFYKRFGEHLVETLHGFFKQFFGYRKRPLQVSLALATSVSLTLCNVLSLWFCVHAMHADLSFVAVLLVFTFGLAIGTATPTPGGLGGVEAGLVAGLVVYRVDTAAALAVVLIYRLISYWLPLVVGATLFTYSQHRHYF